MKRLSHFAVSLAFALPLLTVLGGCGKETATCVCDLSELQELVTALEKQVAAQQAEIADLQASSAIQLNPYLTISSAMINGLAGPHVILDGVNLHIRNGSGATSTINALGNLLVGYNEEPRGLSSGDRGGSHNLIVGIQHNYSSYGGLVAGYGNTVSGEASSISGGRYNTASGKFSSIGGGDSNTASGQYSSVSGGAYNTASGKASSVSGGIVNMARGFYATVSGGQAETASVDCNWVADNDDCTPD
ncbi:MAG: hypothetical protein JSU92_06120 [Deltaproteobacteria bacterium]|nr:MAG: hypothetical protein JSU92_06120 [Deltaproteobacteria bacterium]